MRNERGTERHDSADARERAGISARLPDGSVAELIYRSEEGRTAFVVLRSGTLHEQDTIETAGGRRLRPYSAANALLENRIVLFPSRVDPYGTAEELLDEVRHFLHRYVDLSPDFEEIAAHYVLLTWIHDEFDALPYLRVRGDYGSGKSRFLQTVGSLCYKPIFASGASSVSSLFRMIEIFRGTLVLDESDFRATDERAEITKILNNGNSRGFPVLRTEQSAATKEFSPRAFQVYGPKIIASRRHFEDKALESRCITEELVQGRLRPEVPLSLPKSFEKEAEGLRNRLLLWRFLSLGERREDLLPLRDLEPRVAQVFAPLIATAGSPEARERILSRARETSGDLVSERETTLEAEILAVVQKLEKEGCPLSVSVIADRLRERCGFEYEYRITPRSTGHVLRRRLLLKTRKSHGVFIIPSSEFPKLRRLYARYRVGDFGDLGDFPAEDGQAPESEE